MHPPGHGRGGSIRSVRRIGLGVLQRGGNAVDAAVTTGFAMGVLQPFMNGIGGGGLMTVHMAAGGGGAIDYGMQAPGRATTDEFPLEGGMEGMDTGSSRYSRNFAWPKVKDDMLSSGVQINRHPRDGCRPESSTR